MTKTKSEQKEICGNCLNFIEAENLPKGAGACRRYPPGVHAVLVGSIHGQQTQALQSNYPAVQSDWVCGEFQEKKNVIH